MTATYTHSTLAGEPTYTVRRCNERSNPLMVAEALRIHANGYLSMGFLNNEAVTDEGFIHSDLDRSRGENTDYYIVNNTADVNDCATLRKVRLQPGATIAELDCYELCHRSLYPEAEMQLELLLSSHQPLVEISALARGPEASPAAVWHLLRAAFRDSRVTNEVWFFCLVVSTYGSLASNLGPSFMKIVGDDVSIDDGRVNASVLLRPVIFDTATFLDTMLDDFVRTEGRDRTRLERSLFFFSEGLDESAMSPAVASFRSESVARSTRR